MDWKDDSDKPTDFRPGESSLPVFSWLSQTLYLPMSWLSLAFGVCSILARSEILQITIRSEISMVVGGTIIVLCSFAVVDEIFMGGGWVEKVVASNQHYSDQVQSLLSALQPPPTHSFSPFYLFLFLNPVFFLRKKRNSNQVNFVKYL